MVLHAIYVCVVFMLIETFWMPSPTIRTGMHLSTVLLLPFCYLDSPGVGESVGVDVGLRVGVKVAQWVLPVVVFLPAAERSQGAAKANQACT
jgi:hypothetical protein